MTLSVIVVAAGSGERLGSSRPKAFVDLVGHTLLERCLAPIAELSESTQVVVVAPEAWLEPARQLASSVLPGGHSLEVVSGGSTRTESVRRGLQALASDADVVLIHDAARALTPLEVFNRVIEAVKAGHSGVIPTLDIVDTIVPQTLSGLTGAAIDRRELAAVQTPQGFMAAELLQAYESFSGDATDDAEVLRAAGHEVVSVAGDRDSLKITYPHDLDMLAARLGGGVDIRVGVGVDVHRFEDGRPLVVGGMTFDSDRGLAGHSDGDVLLHAITDALLGAAGLGDLGTHFGSNRPEFEGASSRVFLERALELIGGAGFRPQSVSVQFIGNTPKLGDVRAEVGKALGLIVGAPVHVSATTTDGLGLTGRGEGAAAIAQALVVRH